MCFQVTAQIFDPSINAVLTNVIFQVNNCMTQSILFLNSYSRKDWQKDV